MNISTVLRDELARLGVAKYGFANLHAVPEEQRNGYDYAVALILPLDAAIVAGNGDGPTAEYAQMYDRVGQQLDDLGDQVAEVLQQHGYRAFNQRRNAVVWDRQALKSPMPHKTVATRAGLGWIGKCALLITPEYGAAQRLTSVLTDAPLEVGTPIDESRCGNCMVCVQRCPGQAPLGPNWGVSMGREEFFDAFKCCETALARAAKIGVTHPICGVCMAHCPWTRKYLRRQGQSTAFAND